MLERDQFIFTDYWRTRMYAEINQAVDAVYPFPDTGVEFGGSNGVLQSMFPGTAFETRHYPRHDVCNPDSWEANWDIVLMDQVLEHVQRPWHVFDLLARHTKKIAILTLPFLALIHDWCPDDYWRMTPSAVRLLAGGSWRSVEVGSWGNDRAVHWLARYGFDMPSLLANVSEAELRSSLDENNASIPVMIWVILRK